MPTATTTAATTAAAAAAATAATEAAAASPAAASLPPGLALPPPRASGPRATEDAREVSCSSREEMELAKLHEATDRYERNMTSFRKLRREGGYALRSWYVTLHKAEQARR